ncbi:hypothetical protein OE88DRAFT_1611020, partial [Heliocybe sulcata]
QHNKIRRYSHHPDGNGTYKEIVLHVNGVLCGKDLPPQLEDLRFRPNQTFHKGYLKQSVRLTGYSHPTFQAALDGLSAIANHISRSFKEGVLVPWSPSEFDGHPTIEIGNNFFAARKFVPTEPDVPFDAKVDPRGILAQLKDAQYIHTEDNRVTFWELQEDPASAIVLDTICRYSSADPAIFRDGDIVEAEFSIFAIPQNRRYRVALVLRLLTLVD